MSSFRSDSLLVDPPIDMPQEPTVLLRFSALLRQWWVAFMASSIFVVSGHLLIKAGLNAAASHSSGVSGSATVLHAALQPAVVIGLATYCFGSICWIIAVAQQEISFLYPLSSLNYVLVVVASSMLFGETISVLRGAGVGMIVLGMVLMNRLKKGTPQ